MNSNGYDSEYDREEYSAMSHEHHRTCWKVRGAVEINLIQGNPRTGDDDVDTAIWLHFDWVDTLASPDEEEDDVAIRDGLRSIASAVNNVLIIDAVNENVLSYHLEWEAND